MNKISLDSLLDIDIWLDIAYCSQKFSILMETDKEKMRNLVVLKKYMKHRGYVLDKEDGLNLILAIYNLLGEKNYRKAYFYEQICALKDIGVKKLAFMPMGFPKNIIGLTDLKKNCNSIIVKGAYTNGVFNVREWGSDGYQKYSMINLEDANYVIVKTMDREANCVVDVVAYVKDFNGKYPSFRWLKKFKQANLCLNSDELYYQKYGFVNKNMISCKKQLVLKRGKQKKSNQYYYDCCK